MPATPAMTTAPAGVKVLTIEQALALAATQNRDIQKAIEAINEEWAKKTGPVWDEYDKTGRDFALKLGNQMIWLSKEEDERWFKRVSTTFDDYLADMKKKGLQGDEALKFCLDTLKKS